MSSPICTANALEDVLTKCYCLSGMPLRHLLPSLEDPGLHFKCVRRRGKEKAAQEGSGCPWGIWPLASSWHRWGSPQFNLCALWAALPWAQTMCPASWGTRSAGPTLAAPKPWHSLWNMWHSRCQMWETVSYALKPYWMGAVVESLWVCVQ